MICSDSDSYVKVNNEVSKYLFRQFHWETYGKVTSFSKVNSQPLFSRIGGGGERGGFGRDFAIRGARGRVETAAVFLLSRSVLHATCLPSWVPTLLKLGANWVTVFFVIEFGSQLVLKGNAGLNVACPIIFWKGGCDWGSVFNWQVSV